MKKESKKKDEVDLPDSFVNGVAEQENDMKKGWDPKKQKWYPHDSVEGGNKTCAYGFKEVESGQYKEGLTEKQAREILSEKLKISYKEAQLVYDRYVKEKGAFDKLPLEYRLVATDMVFNMGMPEFKKFTEFMTAARRNDLDQAVATCGSYGKKNGAKVPFTRRAKFRGSILQNGQKEIRAGGIWFDISAVIKSNGYNIVGVLYDSSNGGISLFSKFPGVDLTKKIRLFDDFFPEDVSAMIRVMYNSSGDIAFSLDPSNPMVPDGPYMKKVYYPSSLQCTSVGYSMWLADWKLKQLSFGVSYDDTYKTYTDKTEEIRKVVPSYRSSLERKQVDNDSSGGYSRMWFIIDNVEYEEGIVGSARAMVLKNVRLRVKGRRTVPDPSAPTGLRDQKTDDTHHTKQFARNVSERMDDYCNIFPEFKRLKDLACLFSIIKWLRDIMQVPAEMIDWNWIRSHNRYYREDYPELMVPTLRNQKRTISHSGSTTTTHTYSVYGGVSFNLKKETRRELSASSKELILDALKLSISEYSKRSVQHLKKQQCFLVPLMSVMPGSCTICDSKVFLDPAFRSFSGKENVQTTIQSHSATTWEQEIFCKLHHPMRCSRVNCLKNGVICFEKYIQTQEGELYHSDCFLCGKCELAITERSYSCEKGINFHTWCVDQVSALEFQEIKEKEQSPIRPEKAAISAKVQNHPVVKELLSKGYTMDLIEKMLHSLISKLSKN